MAVVSSYCEKLG